MTVVFSMTRDEAAAALVSLACPGCHRTKSQLEYFCRSCFFALPPEDRPTDLTSYMKSFEKLQAIRRAKNSPDPAQLREIGSRLLELAQAGKITADDAANAYREFLRALKRIGKLSPAAVAKRLRKWELHAASRCPRCGQWKTASAKICAECRHGGAA